jgi:VIT1/CCC1 family predicted Fe2+/Mn2+ transporter
MAFDSIDTGARMRHLERHRMGRTGWLRAAVLGANDGVISTASLMIGVAAAGSAPGAVLSAGIAGLAAGAMSMAAGEYVSVRSQADTERADIARERSELAMQPELERAELEGIYRQRGLDAELARQVAAQLMAKDALGAHVRDELGITEAMRARPLQAALASAGSFALGALVPVAAAVSAPGRPSVTVACTLVTLLGLGTAAAWAGGSPKLPGAARVAFWGALAMAVTAGAGRLFGVVVG